MNSHCIDILDRADDDDVIRTIAHDLELELLPSDDASLDQHLAYRRKLDAAAYDLLELLAVVRDATPRAAESEGRPDDRRKSHHLRERESFVERRCDSALRHREPDPAHGVRELPPVLRHRDCACVGPD